jgi:glycerol-3-phosphate dehydrogenase (NAD+)
MASSSSSSSSQGSSSSPEKPLRLAIIGSGNWGSAIARIAGNNLRQYPDLFVEEVRMYVHQEVIDGEKLTDIINSRHENVKYLPGIKLPENVKAVESAEEAARGADLLIFVLPHQFIENVCKNLKGKVAKDARAISMIKGVEVKNGNIRIFADVIEEILGCKCAALSGANIANEGK